jgi:hypothetical protein
MHWYGRSPQTFSLVKQHLDLAGYMVGDDGEAEGDLSDACQSGVELRGAAAGAEVASKQGSAGRGKGAVAVQATATPAASSSAARAPGRPSRETLAEMDDLRREVRRLQAGVLAPPVEEPDRPLPVHALGRTPQIAPQFFEEGARLGLGDEQLQRLLGMAGPSPKRLRDPYEDEGGGGKLLAEAPEVRGARRTTPFEPVPLEPPRPSVGAQPDVMGLLMQQNQMLMTMLAKQTTQPSVISRRLSRPQSVGIWRAL